MLSKSHYYHGTIRNLVIAFGRIFQGLRLHRVNSRTQEIEQIIEVPVSYGPREKWLARLQETPNTDKKIAITLPRIGFELTGMKYDPTRKIQKMNQLRSEQSAEKTFETAFSPVPYNMFFNLYVVAKTNDDALQIVEQILPFFPPQFTVTLNLVPSADIQQDIPITLMDVNFTDSYEGSFETRREIIYTLSFEVKCNLYGPVSTSSTILKTIVNIDPEYGTIARRATSEAISDGSGNWEIIDEIFDIERDPANY
jgi:hypothetical protein